MSEGKRQAHGKQRTHGQHTSHGLHKAQGKQKAHGKQRASEKQRVQGTQKADQEPKTDEQQKAEELDRPRVPPDRLSIDPTSRFYEEEIVERGVGIRFRGTVRKNVHEYCISEGWVRMAVGKTVDRHGRPLMVKTKGPVEAWFEDLGEDPPVASQDTNS